jgi:hypothetical protein
LVLDPEEKTEVIYGAENIIEYVLNHISILRSYVVSPPNFVMPNHRITKANQDMKMEKKFHWGGFKMGELCNRCRKGQLQMTDKKEDTGTYRAEFLRCDYCGSEFKNQRIGF